MYETFYTLTQRPFNVTSNPALFFESRSHREAMSVILYGIQERKGIIVISGEVGTGKTTLCKVLLEKIPPNIKTSLILNPYFSPIQLLRAILKDFGLNILKGNKLDLVNSLNEFLLSINSAGGTAVLIIDEAQNLSNRQLEEIRLLSNLETFCDKLLQIVLIGQPELEEKLSQDALRQIKQRVFVKYHLKPLEKDEIMDYINFRLEKSKGNKLSFLPSTQDLIYQFSQGIPRLINMICDRALLCGFVKNTFVIDENIIKDSIKELV